ncbi:hypothetical protein C0J52_18580 [Blattella germanica]|nr:hypothetical protein C0J52_18580 [Blattella germanica]
MLLVAWVSFLLLVLALELLYVLITTARDVIQLALISRQRNEIMQARKEIRMDADPEEEEFVMPDKQDCD